MKFAPILLVFLPCALAAAEPRVQYHDHPAARDVHDDAVLAQRLVASKQRFDRLKAEQGIRLEAMEHTVEMKWPVRESITAPGISHQSLSNFLDQDPDQGVLLDWDCGERTYDGHNGTDISVAPFAWYGMRNDQLIVVAAADGVIADMEGDNPEDSCQANTNDGDNNFVAIEHADGSWSIYAHMRTGSLTRKQIGDPVSAGEYLGVVGSAGISTGPHLHFGVGFWEQDGNLLRFVEQDPWQGSCNTINPDSWWETQPPYLVPELMAAATHSQQPEFPPCPQSEKPHFADSFSAGDTIWFSWTIRDQLQGVMANVAVKQPNGAVFTQLQSGDANADAPGARTGFFGFDLPPSAASGEWALEVSYDGTTLMHPFWVNVLPPGPDPIPPENNQFNGLWYDPALDGEGYNIVTTPAGTVIFFYGSDAHGKRLWLISETVDRPFVPGENLEIVMYESTGGVFDAPMPSGRGLSAWGTLVLTFTGCGEGSAQLHGEDGEKLSAIVKLASVPGTGCSSGNRTDNVWSGLWFNPSLDGEGFNLIVAPNGVVVFFYGFDSAGNRIWGVSETLADAIDDGSEHSMAMYRADAGSFAAPVPSSQSLVAWGTLFLTVNGCSAIDYVLETSDGDKVTGTVRLAGILGLACS